MAGALQTILKSMEMVGGPDCSVKIEYFGRVDRNEEQLHYTPFDGTARITHQLTPESARDLYEQLKVIQRWTNDFRDKHGIEKNG